MNKINRFILALAGVMMLSGVRAQEPTPSSGDEFLAEVMPLLNKSTKQQLNQALQARNHEVSSESASWYEIGYGYYAVYSNEGTSYLAFFNREGNHVKTLTEKDWTSVEVPSNLRSSYHRSPYRSLLLAACWEFSILNKKQYYLELEDVEGNLAGIWADEKGRFSAIPPVLISRKMNQMTAVAKK